MCKAAELIASKMGAGFFPWSSLIKSSKNKTFSRVALDRLKVANSSVKTSFVEIVRTWLKPITGLSVKPIEVIEYYKCNPCEAAFYRYPLNLRASAGCINAMFGGSLMCEAKRPRSSTVSDTEQGCESETELHPVYECHKQDRTEPSSSTELVCHPHQPLNKCYRDSRVLVAHGADRTLVNRSGKLVAHCVIDYCLPRYMYSSALGSSSLNDCKEHLLASITSVRQRLNRANVVFNTLMNNCPEHMIPVHGTRELERLRINRETVTRLPGEKLEACLKVITEDMSLRADVVYRNLSARLGNKLSEAMSQGTVSVRDVNGSAHISSDTSISLTLPAVILADAGIVTSTGRLSIARSELCERTLVDLAGVIYQTVIMLQIRSPDVFGSAIAMYPESVLCIMPYSCADVHLMRTWIEAFRAKKWLKPTQVKPGKRKRSDNDHMEVTYHCTGCKNFYMDLYANHVRGRNLLGSVYTQDKRRKIGQCVCETQWRS